MIESYGAELELADLNRKAPLPQGCNWDTKDFSMVNSDGIAVDPTGKLHDRGGEVQTWPTCTIPEQVGVFREVMYAFPQATVNYRSNLHVHVRILGLKSDLKLLKSLQRFVHEVFQPVLPILEPIPKPTEKQYPDPAAFEGAMARFKRRKRSHQMFLSADRVKRQMEAKTVEEFFENEVPRDGEGKPMWHAQARCCVNIRQLLQTNTIEFRHFPGTTNPAEFRAALAWVCEFISAWQDGFDVESLTQLARMHAKDLPTFRPYDHRLEQRYALTTHDGSVPRAQLIQNIRTLQMETML